MEQDAASYRPLPTLLRVLMAFTRSLPPLPRISGLSNRLVKPFWCSRHAGVYTFTVWPGIRMVLDPCDTVGGNLAFIPQLYDRWERKAIRQLLPRGGTFVDVGANIGAYTLWAAHVAGEDGGVVAFEAEPRNYGALLVNLRLNSVTNARVFNVGVSDRQEELDLHLNATGNSGGNTFVPGVHGPGARVVKVKCLPLAMLLADAGVTNVDFLKLDIEGFEAKVLSKFFVDCPADSPMRPRHVLTELSFGRGDAEGLIPMMAGQGYACVVNRGGNALFASTRPPQT